MLHSNTGGDQSGGSEYNMNTPNNQGPKKVLRAVVGLGLGLMVVSYVVSVKSDLFRAQIVSDPMTAEESIVMGSVTGEEPLFAAAPDVVADTMTGEDSLMAAAGDVMTGEFAVVDTAPVVADVFTGEGLLAAAGDVMTGEAVVEVSAPAVAEEEVVLTDDDFGMDAELAALEEELALLEGIADEATEEVANEVAAPIFDEVAVEEEVVVVEEPVVIEEEEIVVEEPVAVIEEDMIEEEDVMIEELMSAPMEQEKLVDSGANPLMLALLFAIAAWGSMIAFKKETGDISILAKK